MQFEKLLKQKNGYEVRKNEGVNQYNIWRMMRYYIFKLLPGCGLTTSYLLLKDDVIEKRFKSKNKKTEIDDFHVALEAMPENKHIDLMCKIKVYYSNREDVYYIRECYDESSIYVNEEYVLPNIPNIIETSMQIYKDVLSLLSHSKYSKLSDVFDGLVLKEEAEFFDYAIRKAREYSKYQLEKQEDRYVFHLDMNDVRKIKIMHSYALKLPIYINDMKVIDIASDDVFRRSIKMISEIIETIECKMKTKKDLIQSAFRDDIEKNKLLQHLNDVHHIFEDMRVSKFIY